MVQYLECGKVANTHGIRGALLVNSWCDSPDILTRIKALYLKKNGDFSPLKVESAVIYKRMLLIFFEGITSLDLALPLKGQVLYAKREDIPLSEGDHFIADLIGLSVIDIDTKRVYGTLKDVLYGGASDLYVVRMPDKREVLIPAVDEFVIKIDLLSGIYIKPIEGMFD